eukprot:6176126-Pleurochrysis_carterae.AAC.4
MKTAGFPLSPGLLKLAGESESSTTMNTALARPKEDRANSRQRVRQRGRGWPGRRGHSQQTKSTSKWRRL